MTFQLIHIRSVNICTEPCFCHPYRRIFIPITQLSFLGVSLKIVPFLKAPVATLKSYRNLRSVCVSVSDCVLQSPGGTAGFISVKMKPEWQTEILVSSILVVIIKRASFLGSKVDKV